MKIILLSSWTLSVLFSLSVLLPSCESLYNWRCSTPGPTTAIPDIPVIPESIGDTDISPHNHVYTFAVPPAQTCAGGLVSSIEYCFIPNGGNGIQPTNIFDILVLEGNPSATSQFTIRSVISIPSPSVSQNICNQGNNLCCMTHALMATDQFTLGPNFSFGVKTAGNGHYLAAFHSSGIAEYGVSTGLVISSGFIVAVGQTYTATLAATQTLRILRFVIPVDTTATTHSTTEPETTQEPTTATQPTEVETDPPEPTTGASTQETTVTGPTTQSTTNPATTSTNVDPTGGSISRPTPFPIETVAGALVGVFIFIVTLIISVVVVIVCIRKSTRNWDVPETQGHDGFNNAIYESENTFESSISKSKYTAPPVDDGFDYSRIDSVSHGSKPIHEYAELDNLKKPMENFEYAYADSGPDTMAPLPKTNPPQHRPHSSRYSRDSRSSGSETIYMVPASDENSLYAQFTEIKIKPLKHSAIRLKEKLGSGQFGTVHKAEWFVDDTTSVMVAVKTLNKGSDETDKVKFLQEAAIMGQFKHPNVVKLHGVVIEAEPIMIILELLSTGDLRDHLLKSKESKGPVIDAHTLLSYCRQIASGMAYLAGKAFVHRDLAARNILVSEDGVCKIADFGMSRDLMDETYYISHGGKIPVKWTAPEAIHYKKYSTASDVWSFGCVMYEIWSLGHKPFEAFSNSQVIAEIEQGFRDAPPPGTPREIYRLMMDCWHPVKSERPTFTDLMQEFSLPDTKLLKWSDEDKNIHPEADILGARLTSAQYLYKDLQESYLIGDMNLLTPYEVPISSNPF